MLGAEGGAQLLHPLRHRRSLQWCAPVRPRSAPRTGCRSAPARRRIQLCMRHTPRAHIPDECRLSPACSRRKVGQVSAWLDCGCDALAVDGETYIFHVRPLRRHVLTPPRALKFIRLGTNRRRALLFQSRRAPAEHASISCTRYGVPAVAPITPRVSLLARDRARLHLSLPQIRPPCGKTCNSRIWYWSNTSQCVRQPTGRPAPARS